MNLLIDLGNSSSKWALEEGGKIIFDGRNDIVELRDVMRERSGAERNISFERILVGSVIGAQRNSQVGERLLRDFECEPEFVAVEKQCRGLTIAYDNVSNLGVDRWLAMLAAWSFSQSAFVVVDAGSALTVDVVDDTGQHEGGFIVPGLALMQGALYSRTEAVKVPPLSLPSKWQLGRDTRDCVENGVSALYAGMFSELERKHGAKVVIFTGGDASRLRALYPRDAELRPNLVLEGLLSRL